VTIFGSSSTTRIGASGEAMDGIIGRASVADNRDAPMTPTGRQVQRSPGPTARGFDVVEEKETRHPSNKSDG